MLGLQTLRRTHALVALPCAPACGLWQWLCLKIGLFIYVGVTGGAFGSLRAGKPTIPALVY